MSQKITRRDFLNGAALTTGVGVMAPSNLWALESLESGAINTAYPPTLTGMRGSHKGSFEVAHALAWEGKKPARYDGLDEHYDLVVVGAGMSGLAAAYYYRQKMGLDARILILDNHDDFGGHAKRNEFHHQGRMVLSLGGAQNLDNPGNYSDHAGALMIELGIDADAIAAMDTNTPDDFLLGGKLNANVGISTPGADGKHVNVEGHWYKFMHGRGDYAMAVRQLPISADEQDRLIAFFGGAEDFLNDLSLGEQFDYIRSVSYNRFLMDKVGLSQQSIAMFDGHLLVLNGVSGWQHTVLEAISAGAPGLRAMGWVTNFVDSLAAMMIGGVAEIRMFPDGNASVARLIVQKLIPGVAPNMQGITDVAVAQFNYGALDRENQSVRLRLNSTVVGVRETADDGVVVEYVRGGNSLSVTASHCVLACYNNLIPHLCPEMSERQKAGLSYGVRSPFVYANVLLNNGLAFSKLNLTFTHCPHDAFQWVSSAPTMSNGGYEPPRGPEDPMAVFMMGSPTPAVEGSSARELCRAGRYKIYSTTFAQYEAQIRQQLQSLLGQYGFDHETDIQAITVNRIPHGYAYSYLGLDDPEWEEGKAPHEIGRAQFGRISIANSDSEAMPLMDAAFDAAWRAVAEQTA
ncbi:MAG: Tat pathway signal protein [Gammaproteobacteria bacterium]|nr:Tat pathway signal protein [Gammaproteobacteria bacterium]